MYKNILIATDGSDLADKAVEQGLNLAKGQNAKVTVMTVTEPWSPMEMASKLEAGRMNAIEEFEKEASERAAAIFAHARQLADKHGVTCETVHVPDKHPADGIVATCEERKCDLIVMASHGRRGVRRLLLGSQALEVVTRSKVPVLICR